MDSKKLIETRLVNGAGRPSILIVDLKMKALNRVAFKELNEILTHVEMFQHAETSDKIDGVVFTSSDPKIFLAGADLYEMEELLDHSLIASTVIEVGQETFNRIHRLKIPTVAAIHGICLGGGYELSLACDYRICSNDKSTKIGLPEVTLGILPAWGGTVRLPRLIGTSNALNVILTGRQFAPKPALKLGLVDVIDHKENIINTACKIVRGEKIIKRKFNWSSLLPVSLVARIAKKNVLKKTKGNYPAPIEIIDTVTKIDPLSIKDGFVHEKAAFLKLIKTPEMQNLLRIFFLQEKAKKLKILTAENNFPKPSKFNVTVVGAGTMGAGIAQWVSSRGNNVYLHDIDEELISAGLKKIGDLYVQGVRKHKFDRPHARAGLARITPVTSHSKLHNQDILIEAIVEKMVVKKQVLATLEEKLPEHAIIATNTSALSINEMAKILKRPEQFVGIHFFNPVHQMKLVEIVRGELTSDETVQRAVDFVKSIGKLPVVVNDSPGFVVNRVLIPYLVEAVNLLNSGYDIGTIDDAMIKWGMPMGPFRLMDEIGLDVCQHVASDICAQLDRPLPDNIQSLIDKGCLGKKSGKGFYEYKNGKCVRHTTTPDLKKRLDIQLLLGTSMIAEAMDVYKEGVVENRDMIDLAMIMGTGFAPFKGGPMQISKKLNL